MSETLGEASLLSGGDGGTAGTAAPDPRSWLPEAYRADPTFQDLKDLDGLAKSYKHAAAMVGVDRNEFIRLPKDMEKGDLSEVYDRLGRPKAPDGYGLKGPDGLPPETLAEFSKTLHGAGINTRQAQAIMDWYGGQVGAIQQQQGVAAAAQRDATITALKQEWGAAFDDSVHAARRAVKEMGGEGVEKALQETGLGNHPEIVKFFAKLGRQNAEPGGLRGGGTAGFGSALTPAAAQAEIRQLQGDREFGKQIGNRSDAGHKAAKERWDQLHAYGYPEQAK